jgi:HAD superfamily hydrolase (TIGR01509 family)
MAVKLIILDFGGTLAEGSIDWDEYHSSIHEYLRSLGFDVGLKELKEAISAALKHLEGVRRREEELTLEEVYARALARLGIPERPDLLEGIHGLFRRHFKTELYPCVERTLESLSRRYRLAVISNTMSDNPRVFLSRTGLIRYFDLVVCSRDLGVRKPNPKIFKYVLERLGVEAHEAVHVGDEPEIDIQGAQRSGIKAILVEREGKNSEWCGPTIRSICQLPEVIEELSEADP